MNKDDAERADQDRCHGPKGPPTSADGIFGRYTAMNPPVVMSSSDSLAWALVPASLEREMEEEHGRDDVDRASVKAAARRR